MKQIFAIVLVLAMVVPAVAQDDGKSDEHKGGHAWGFKGYGGFGIPTYENLPEGSESTTGFAWAAALYYNWSTSGLISFAVQPELMYVSEAGASTVTGGAEPTAEITSTVSSLRLPILAKLQFLDARIVQPSIYIGPSFSYVLSATNEIQGVEQDLDSKFKVGLAAGVDVNILSFLVVDVRYNTKFTTLTSDIDQDIENLGEFTLAMSSLKFGLGLRF